jgi:hypothetical protein
MPEFLEPIRQVGGDGRRETAAVHALSTLYPNWRFYPTPRFYFTDFHLTWLHENGRENYLGDIEIKWLSIDSSIPAIFPFNKLQQMLISPPYLDNPDTFHRICFRFTDGTLLIPVKELAGLMPEFNVRHDTNERDLVVRVNAMMFKRYWIDVVIKE